MSNFKFMCFFLYVQFQVQAFFSARTLSVSGMAVLHFILKFLCFQNLKLSNCFTHSSTGICVCSRLWRTLAATIIEGKSRWASASTTSWGSADTPGIDASGVDPTAVKATGAVSHHPQQAGSSSSCHHL